MRSHSAVPGSACCVVSALALIALHPIRRSGQGEATFLLAKGIEKSRPGGALCREMSDSH